MFIFFFFKRDKVLVWRHTNEPSDVNTIKSSPLFSLWQHGFLVLLLGLISNSWHVNWDFQENSAIRVPHNVKVCDISCENRSQLQSSSLRYFPRTQAHATLPWTPSLNLAWERNTVQTFKDTLQRHTGRICFLLMWSICRSQRGKQLGVTSPSTVKGVLTFYHLLKMSTRDRTWLWNSCPAPKISNPPKSGLHCLTGNTTLQLSLTYRKMMWPLTDQQRRRREVKGYKSLGIILFSLMPRRL